MIFSQHGNNLEADGEQHLHNDGHDVKEFFTCWYFSGFFLLCGACKWCFFFYYAGPARNATPPHIPARDNMKYHAKLRTVDYQRITYHVKIQTFYHQTMEYHIKLHVEVSVHTLAANDIHNRDYGGECQCRRPRSSADGQCRAL